MPKQRKPAKPLPASAVTKRRTLIARACGTSNGMNHRSYAILGEFADLISRCEFMLGEARELITSKEADEIQEILTYAKESGETLKAVASIGFNLSKMITSREMSSMVKSAKGKVVL